MTEEEALEEADRIQQDPATVEEGLALIKLEKYITGYIFGDLWSNFLLRLPIEDTAELNRRLPKN